MKKILVLVLLFSICSISYSADIDVHGFAQMWYLYKDNGVALKASPIMQPSPIHAFHLQGRDSRQM